MLAQCREVRVAVRILAVLPTIRPINGAVITTGEYLRGLVRAGHTVEIITTGRGLTRPRVVDGIKASPLARWRHVVQQLQPELLITHHRDRRATQIVARLRGLPRVLMVHGMSLHRNLGRPSLAWFPSEACRAHYGYGGASIVLPPPVDPARYATTPGGAVTLIGSTTAKGLDVLTRVAERMPDTRFLVVESPRRPTGPLPPNVEKADWTDPRAVYGRTRALVMPSTSETYGRVGVEAMHSGIPVVASPLPALREAFGDAATFVARDDIAGWVTQVRRLSDPAAHAAASAKARDHTRRLDYGGNLRRFTSACEQLVPGSQRSAPVRVGGPAPERADVVAWLHFGVPHKRAGSETMLHTMLRALSRAGLRVLVVCSAMPEAPPAWEVDGVPYRAMTPHEAELFIRACGVRVVVSHHDFAERAVALSKDIGAKSVLVIHNDMDIAARPFRLWPDLCVYNSHWVVDSLKPRYLEVDKIPRLVVHPPVEPDEHRAARAGTHVTLVNLNRDKGVATWSRAAGMLSHLPFLGVLGAHGKQVARPSRPNVSVIRPTSNMRRDVWARTRVLAVPSIYESYGMAAVEALASGIPVIAHPTPGLRESLGDAATFVDRADVPAWAKAIQDLYYAGHRRSTASAAALERSAEIARQSRGELEAWVHTIQDLVRG